MIRGWKPDVIIRRGELVAGRHYDARAESDLPCEFTELAEHVGGRRAGALPVLDQGPTSRCVAFSLAEVLHVAMREAGAEAPPLLDIHYAYVEAQRWEQRRYGARLPLVDEGLHPIDLVESTQRWGILTVPGPDDPRLAPEHVLVDVTEADVRRAASWMLGGWRRIPERGESVVLETKRLLFARMSGMFGLDLDAALQPHAAGVYERAEGAPSAGRHAMTVHGWSDRLGAFLVLNHWGPRAHEGGWLWIGYGTFASRFTRDRYHLRAARV